MKGWRLSTKHDQKHQFFSTSAGSITPLNGLVKSLAFHSGAMSFSVQLVKTRTLKSVEFHSTGPNISLFYLIIIWMKLILYALLVFCVYFL